MHLGPNQQTDIYLNTCRLFTFLNCHFGSRRAFSRFSRFTVAPAGVTISGPTEAKASDQVLITCTTENSNPPADIKWTVDGRNSESNSSRTEPAANGGWITSSNVTFNINHKSRSIVVICHASNVKLTENVVGTHTINVICEFLYMYPLFLCRTHFIGHSVGRHTNEYNCSYNEAPRPRKPNFRFASKNRTGCPENCPKIFLSRRLFHNWRY